MKKTFLMIISILMFQMACKPEMDQKTQDQMYLDQVRALAKKYGIDIKITEPPAGTKKMPFRKIEEIEDQFKMMAEFQKSNEESNRQVRQMTAEVEKMAEVAKAAKSNEGLQPSDYLRLLDKYPLVKQSAIQQQGGELGFKLYKNRLLAKQDSVKSRRLKLRN